MKRCVLYARVSTNNGQQDPEMQLCELREYAQHRGLQIVEEYTDNGVSGSSRKDSPFVACRVCCRARNVSWCERESGLAP